ncbi:MAG TPA: alcohol dehydrogenase [Terriglobales bacterium]|jgi:D-arabinose 1-dehydrogenase-like Zn-dependent alcohol dehydrogenase|nr:alcohol dehydrogenase [Terriglobales bacterium]
MTRMKVAQVSKAGGPFEIVERDIPSPGPGQVRIKVEACGICHSDALVKNAVYPGLQLPRVPGHEISGRIDAVGAGVAQWRPGQRVGVGWHGGHCFVCDACRRGDFILCQNEKITGISFDGGYGEYTIAPAEAVASLPDSLLAEEAAPLLCAGITVFNSMRNSGTRAGDLVAVQGIGGLGHLGVQFARHMGFQTVAIGRGGDKEVLAKKLGAHAYIDSGATDAAAELKKLGGARLILATAPDAKSISGIVGGLAGNGKLLVVGVPYEPISVSVMQIVGRKNAIQGWPSGSSIDSEDTLRFSALSGVRPMIEKYPLSKVNEAFEQMHSGRVRFRVVLTMGA